MRLLSFPALSDLVEGSIFLCIFFCVCVSMCCVYFPALCGGKELDHILYSAECSSICFKYLLSGMKLALIPEAVTKPMFFFWGGGVFHLKWMYVVQTFWGSIKKAVLCGNSHIPQLDLLKASRNGLAVNSSRYLQTPGRARFVLCNLVLSDDFIHKYMV